MKKNKGNIEYLKTEYSDPSVSSTLLTIQTHYYEKSQGIQKITRQIKSQKKKKSEKMFSARKNNKHLQKVQDQYNKNNEFIRKIIYDNKRLSSEYEKLSFKYKALESELNTYKTLIQIKNKNLIRHLSCNNSNSVSFNEESLKNSIKFQNLSYKQQQILKFLKPTKEENLCEIIRCESPNKQQNLQIEKNISNLKNQIKNYENKLQTERLAKQNLQKKLLNSENQVKILWESMRKKLKINANLYNKQQKQTLIKTLQIENLNLKLQLQSYKNNLKCACQSRIKIDDKFPSKQLSLI